MSNYKSYTKEVQDKIKKAQKASVEAIGLTVEATTVEKMSQVGLYAGFGDMVDTGRLRASIDHDSGENSVLIGTNVEYADYVFLGTQKVTGRNVIWDAVVQDRETIKQIVLDIFQRMLR